MNNTGSRKIKIIFPKVVILGQASWLEDLVFNKYAKWGEFGVRVTVVFSVVL